MYRGRYVEPDRISSEEANTSYKVIYCVAILEKWPPQCNALRCRKRIARGKQKGAKGAEQLYFIYLWAFVSFVARKWIKYVHFSLVITSSGHYTLNMNERRCP